MDRISKRTKSLALSLVISALLITLLTSCSKTMGSENTVIFHTYDDEYTRAVKDEVEKSVKDSNLNYCVKDGAGLDNTVLAEVDTAIMAKTKLLTVNLSDKNGDELAKKVIEKAKNADIPLILFGGSVSNSVLSSYDKCIHVTNDFEAAGRMQGRLIGNYLVDNYDKIDLNKDGKIGYVLIRDMNGSSENEAAMLCSISECNAILEQNGFPPLSFYDDKNNSALLSADLGKTNAKDMMKDILATFNMRNNNMVELAIGESDAIALGLVSALGDIGFNRNGEKGIPVFGIGASNDAMTSIENGMMTGTVKISGKEMADTLLKISNNILGGKSALDGINKDLTRGAQKVCISPTEA